MEGRGGGRWAIQTRLTFNILISHKRFSLFAQVAAGPLLAIMNLACTQKRWVVHGLGKLLSSLSVPMPGDRAGPTKGRWVEERRNFIKLFVIRAQFFVSHSVYFRRPNHPPTPTHHPPNIPDSFRSRLIYFVIKFRKVGDELSKDCISIFIKIPLATVLIKSFAY